HRRAAVDRQWAAQPRGRVQPSFSLAAAARNFWQESLWPWRRTWLGLAAIWLVLLALNLATNERPKVASHKMPPPDPELMAALREQRRLMLQALEPIAPPPALHPKIPGPRSEQRQTMILA
ncbi:MAG: hypothetical protein AAB676_16660, partial [Verrucomicrobiota bacterium]